MSNSRETIQDPISRIQEFSSTAIFNKTTSGIIWQQNKKLNKISVMFSTFLFWVSTFRLAKEILGSFIMIHYHNKKSKESKEPIFLGRLYVQLQHRGRSQIVDIL